jgi:hypothetical protein
MAPVAANPPTEPPVPAAAPPPPIAVVETTLELETPDQEEKILAELIA